MRWLCSTLILAGAGAFAQAPPAAATSAGSYSGQSWVGLLVSASCEPGKGARTSAATAEANLTVGDRVTTPAVDASGTRGQSTLLSDEAPGDSNDRPWTGDVLSANGPSNPALKSARKQATALPEGCRVDASTLRFALLLPDGKLLRFNDLANQGIAKQMQANPPSGKAILRVEAAGKVQNGLVALNTIRM